jgi:ATP-dependent DNA ligase
MSRVVKCSASQADKPGPSRRGTSRSDSPLPRFIPPQLSQPVEKPPSGPQWLHEIKLDGFRPQSGAAVRPLAGPALAAALAAQQVGYR